MYVHFLCQFYARLEKLAFVYNERFLLKSGMQEQIIKSKTYNTITKKVILFTEQNIYYLLQTQCCIVEQRTILCKAIILRKVLFFLFAYTYIALELLSFMWVTNNKFIETV